MTINHPAAPEQHQTIKPSPQYDDASSFFMRDNYGYNLCDCFTAWKVSPRGSLGWSRWCFVLFPPRGSQPPTLPVVSGASVNDIKDRVYCTYSMFRTDGENINSKLTARVSSFSGDVRSGWNSVFRIESGVPGDGRELPRCFTHVSTRICGPLFALIIWELLYIELKDGTKVPMLF
jgi:hypothetical protein